MPQTYEKHYRNQLMPAHSLGGGFFALSFPHVADLNKLIVRQVVGDPVAFLVNVFNSAEAEGLPDVEQAIYKVMPSVSAAADEVVEVFNDHGYAFKNMDGDAVNNVRRIYVEILPTESDEETSLSVDEDTEWDIAIAGSPTILE